MVHAQDGSTVISGARDRALATAAYTRTFFRSVSVEEFSGILEDTRVLGQQWLVERLYAKQVIRGIVKKIISRINRAYLGEDRLDDYIHDAVVVLMQIAGQGRFDLSKSAGEIACYICLWIEQRIKRVVKKDLRWQSSLSDTGDCPEKCFQNAGTEGPCVFDRDPGRERHGIGAAGMECAEAGAGRADEKGLPPVRGKRNRAASYVMQRHNDYISSLFCSRRTNSQAG